MQRWSVSAAWLCGTGLALALGAVSAQADPPPMRPPCDQYDPMSPARSTRIVLDPSDYTDEHGNEMLTFIETGSIGRVDATLLGGRDSVVGITAIPEISRFSPYYGERLKGISIYVQLAPHRRPARVALELRQVCADHFRNTFLYY